jgi:hypothetical protein
MVSFYSLILFYFVLMDPALESAEICYFSLSLGFLAEVSFWNFLVMVCVCACVVLVLFVCVFVFVVFPFFLLFGLCLRRLGRRAISLVLQSNISFFFFCIYSTNITFVLRYVIGLILDLGSGLNHPIVHSYEYLLPRSCLGCIPWHYSLSSIDPRYRQG